MHKSITIAKKIVMLCCNSFTNFCLFLGWFFVSLMCILSFALWFFIKKENGENYSTFQILMLSIFPWVSHRETRNIFGSVGVSTFLKRRYLSLSLCLVLITWAFVANSLFLCALIVICIQFTVILHCFKWFLKSWNWCFPGMRLLVLWLLLGTMLRNSKPAIKSGLVS